ncbi:YeeE/YedE family protein [Saccharothrix coeruleofusca]|uniref:Membrane protein n=1 Tax=Saccharothrix coeruleofusca TaxID=33919 RepID=A0A918ARY4_9PSEU|nr:YeeE/YedE family protein [Saccharothrix coeruleofusca]GGP68174.1 membrane protein [Saccharothrix coeruleofusca]
MPVTVRRVPVVPTDVRVDRRFLGAARTSCAPPPPDPSAPIRPVPLLVASALAVLVTAAVAVTHGAREGVYLALGLLLGMALFHSRFGFASAWQRLVAVGNGQGLRAQALLLGTAATAVAAISAGGLGLFGAVPHAQAGSLGVPLLLGAALFGVGMQLAGSCASGTLFAVGSGQSTIVPALGGFVAGAVFCTWLMPLLDRLPQTGGVLLADHIGWFGSWAITALALLGVVAATLVVQHRRNPPPVVPPPTAHGLARLYRGSWSVFAGAIVLGLLAGVVFLVSGQVWGVTGAYSLWGAKILQLFGAHPEHWPFWREGEQAAALAGSVLADRTSLTNIGIVLGAAVAAAAASTWRLHSRVAWRTALAALLGGFLMGVGSRMSGGCNIGALLGGISSGSLHGWIWGVCALCGAWLGVRCRPLFGLTNPKSDDGVC